MTETFTASNGIRVNTHEDGGLSCSDDDNQMAIGHILTFADPEIVIQAFREFFQHERDEELGRWRWPENPDYVVRIIPGATVGRVVQVLEERDMFVSAFAELTIASHSDFPEHHKAAKAYFDAHPEPKPWHDAKHNEIWALRFENAENFLPYRWDTGESAWFSSNANMAMHVLDEQKIVAARRIWPEEK